MCGIVGLWHGASADLAVGQAVLWSMRDVLRARGPDDAASSVDGAAGLILGHRRLAIVDLSPSGRQPMDSSSGRFTIVFNGEVYNHREIRSALPDVAWRGTSDTETMLAAFEAWGLEQSLSRFVGMFAFALWDREQHRLHLVRDRLGIKPLVWARTQDRSLIFGSDLRALRAHPEFDSTIDSDALEAFFETSVVPAPLTIHASASKVLPGTIATFEDPRSEPRITRFWDPDRIYALGASSSSHLSDAAVLDQLESLLLDSVRLRLLADVPVGAFLSGGIDSSLVVALAQELSPTPLRTFSIGSADARYDESGFAAAVAKHVGTDHTELRVTGDAARAVVPQLSSIYDEPFADSSQIPAYLVSRLARESVTVALSGDGGDEVFGGYNRHVWAPRALAMGRLVPPSARQAIARALRAIPATAWDRLGRARAGRQPPLLADKAQKLSRALEAADVAAVHASLRRQWITSPVLGARRASPGASARNGLPALTALMLGDLVEYLPDDILTKVDRASMAVSLEARVPLLDHRVVELAARMPRRMKVRGSVGKWALRTLLGRRVPKALFDRPKTGFSVPIGAWLRGPLREWAADLLDARALRAAGLDDRLILSTWEAHVAGQRDAGLAMWDVLAFRAWEQGLGAKPIALDRAEGALRT